MNDLSISNSNNKLNTETIKKYTDTIKQKASVIKRNVYEKVKGNINNENIASHLTLNTLFFILFIIYLIIIIVIFNINPYKIITHHNVLFVSICLLFAFLLLMLYFFLKQRKFLFTNKFENKPTIGSFILKNIIMFLTIGFIGFIVVGIFYSLKHTTFLSKILLYTLNLFIVIGFITIIYIFMKRFLVVKNNSILQQIIDIITYIPFVVLMSINYIIEQYNITTKPIWILFCIEIILIILSYILPKILNKIITHDSIVLLKKPKSLRSENIIGNFEILNKGKLKKYNYNYSISSWIYLEAQPPSTNSSYSDNAVILSYGGKPNVYYNGNTNELVISAKIGQENQIIYKTKDIPYQKWMNLVINYQGGYMDIFIDNKLIISVKNVVPYMTYDNIIIGKQNGIYGFISKVDYFNKTLSKDKISWLYKSTKL